MKNINSSIRKMVNYLNNADYNGGFWLPNIQRPFVWNTSQIEKLFDSLMREYPISTLLVWRTKSEIKRRKFIDIYRDGLSLSQYQIPVDSTTKMLVLDGQQRLQSLYIGLMGSYNKKEMFFNILSGDQTSPEDTRYKFRFMLPEKAKFPWVSFRKIVDSNDQPNRQADKLIENVADDLDQDQINRIIDNYWKVHQIFVINETISYQELDSVDNADLYTENDVVEIFIRANSGGTKLGKSDLLFSLLTASWDDADEVMEELLQDLNSGGYSFSRDFILKCCLVMLNKGAAYDVQKFRDNDTKTDIVKKWQDISNAIKDVRDFLSSKTYIRSDKALPSYLALIPVIYFRYTYPHKWTQAVGIDTFILRSLLSGVFGGRPDSLINKCVRKINEQQAFNTYNMFDVIHQDGRNVDVTEETILHATYGSKSIHLLFNLWYRQFNYDPAYDGNLPEVDHIFPQSILKTIKESKDGNLRKTAAYPTKIRDQLANCMLLTADENGFQGKCDQIPEQWFSDKTDEYLRLHLIPENKELWKIQNYQQFIEARKKLIVERFGEIFDLSSQPRLGHASTTSASAIESSAAPDPKMESLSNRAEQKLSQLCDRISAASNNVAGFRTPNNLELAIELGRDDINIWTQHTGGSTELNYTPSQTYAANSPRNSGINSIACPTLVLGNQVEHWKFTSIDELVDFVNWYGQYSAG